MERLGIAQPVDGRNTGHDDHVAARHQRRRGPQTQALDLVVDRHVFFNVSPRRRHEGLGLVVVVIADEVLDGVVGEETLELAIELGGKGLVVAEDDGRPVRLGDDVGHGEGLTGPGHAEQGLERQPVVEPLDQGFDGCGLIALRRKGRLQTERSDGRPQFLRRVESRTHSRPRLRWRMGLSIPLRVSSTPSLSSSLTTKWS